MTAVFGDNFSYTDNTEREYGLPDRSFASFNAAAKEASMSRFYGGIHYKAAIENGIVQGKALGEYIAKNVTFLKKK